MANPKRSFYENTPGSWYVDDECIACGMCESMASDVFRLAKDGSQYFVSRQPMDAAQLAQAEDARDRCPAEAIGKDRQAG